MIPLEKSLDKTIYMARLFDLYGAVLTDRQRRLMELYYFEDLSLAEIADRTGVSRQAVYDVLQRAEKSLLGMEERLSFLGRRLAFRGHLEKLDKLFQALAAGRNHEAGFAGDQSPTLEQCRLLLAELMALA